MNIDQFRKRVELKGQLSAIDEQIRRLGFLKRPEYFASVKIESRTLAKDEIDEQVGPTFSEVQAYEIHNSAFSGASFKLWNDLCASFIDSMIGLLELRKIEIQEQLDRLPGDNQTI